MWYKRRKKCWIVILQMFEDIKQLGKCSIFPWFLKREKEWTQKEYAICKLFLSFNWLNFFVCKMPAGFALLKTPLY